MDREFELIQKVDNLEQKIDRNHRLLLMGLSAISAGIIAAALGLALGSSIRGAALGFIVAGRTSRDVGSNRNRQPKAGFGFGCSTTKKLGVILGGTWRKTVY